MVLTFGVTSSITSNVVSQLSKAANNEWVKIHDVDRNLRSLIIMVTTIQNQFEKLGNEELAKPKWKSWVQQLIDNLFQAEDAIDAMLLAIKRHDHEVVQNQMAMQSSTSVMTKFVMNIKNQVCDLVLHLKKITGARTMDALVSDTADLKKELDMISEGESSKTHEEAKSTELDDAHLGSMRLSILCINPSNTHNEVNLTESREQQKIRIINDYLLNSSSEWAGVTIFGIAGSGKTTLAQSILHNDEIKKQFEHRIWASVPGDFSCPTAVFYLQDETGQHIDHASIRNLLQQDGKTLLVLDDIWNVQPAYWKDSMFADQSHKSKLTLLITTRDPRVAKTTQTHSYHIKRLSKAEWMEVIKQESPSYESNHGHRVEILAENCYGIPLVAKKFGQAMESMCEDDSDFSRWTSGNLWDLEVFRDVIFPALKFNEPNLPQDITKCVVYLTLFPQGYKFKKDELAQLWFAEGFLPSDDELYFESGLIKARNYIEEMYRRSILQLSNLGRQHIPVTYEMHEFLRGFDRSWAVKTCHQVVDEHDNSINLSNQIRHLSVCCQPIPDTLLHAIKNRCKRLRTFLLLHKNGTNLSKIPKSFFSDLRYLRVVNLSKSPITCLPRNICKLNHLRCLDVSNTHLQNLNDKLCEMFSLQILRLKNCINLLGLPENIWKLVNLIFLEVDIKCRIPPHIGSLTKLEALEEYAVEKLEGKEISQLENMNHLQGSIRIKKLENVRNTLEAKGANLGAKHNLKGLELYWTETLTPPDSDTHAESVLDELKPSKWLQELKLICYNGGTFPRWLGSPERDLKKVHLYDCPNIDDLSVFWQLPYLNDLFIENLPKIGAIDHNFIGDTTSPKRFPKLEKLEFRNMANLSSWEEMVPGDFPSLTRISIRSCLEFNVRPSFESLPKMTPSGICINRCGSSVVP